MSLVTKPEDVDPTPGPDGQQRTYLVLSDEERAKGFVRPLRLSYRHVGAPPARYPLRDLTEVERARFAQFGYVKYEAYPEPSSDGSSILGRYWTQQQLDAVGRGCGAVTRMGVAIAETYAVNPRFYGGTYCVGCRTHLPVGERGEFVWEGTEERVGT